MLSLAPHPATLLPLPQATTFHLQWEAVQPNGGLFHGLAHHVFERVDADGLLADLFPARPSPQATRIVHLTPLAFFHPASAVGFQGRDPTDVYLLPALKVGTRYKPMPWLVRWRGQGYRALELALAGHTLDAIAQGIADYPLVARTLDEALAGRPVLPGITQGLTQGEDGAARRLLRNLGVAAIRASARHVGLPTNAVHQCSIRGALPRFVSPTAWTPHEVVGQPTVSVRLAAAGSREGKTAEERVTTALQRVLMHPTFRGDPLRWLAWDHKAAPITLMSFDHADLHAPRSHHATLLEESMLHMLSQAPGPNGCV